MNKDHVNISLKVDSFVTTLNSVTSKERDKPLSEVYANDYNKLLDLFLAAYPDKSNFSPPKIEISGFGGMIQARGNYVDILTFTNQIKSFLDDLYEEGQIS